MEAEQLWQQFCKEKGIDENTYHQSWAFCGGGPAADELLELVLEGKKFGTASLYEDYLNTDDPIPKDDEYSVILNSKEEAVCIVRNYQVKIECFGDVSYFHGYSEGEEERNLEAWRRIHASFFKDDLERLQIDDIFNSHVVLEKFSLEYVIDELKDKVKETDFFFMEPDLRYKKQIEEYRDELLLANSSFDGCLSLKRQPDVESWINHTNSWILPEKDLSKDVKKSTILMCVRKADDKVIGMLQMHYLPENHPKYYVGNIGYNVLPSQRGKGYGNMILNRGLTIFKYAFSRDVAEIAALPENVLSKKVIISNGGIYRDTITVEEDHVTLERYLIDLKDR